MNERIPGELRVLLAAGSRELEGRLTRELPAAGIVITGRCLDGPSLLERATEPGSDAVLAVANLHRLTGETLRALAESVPLVLLTGPADDLAQLSEFGCVVPAGAPAAVVAAALHQAAQPGIRRRDPVEATAPRATPAPSPDGSPSRSAEIGRRGGRVVALTSGKGAPGKTTLAIALAALFAEDGSQVVLLDADLRGGNVAPYLDLDPRRGLVGLSAADARLDDEVQQRPDFSVLAGVERPALAAGLRPGTLRAALGELRGRFETVVVDLASTSSDQPRTDLLAAGLLRAGDELLLVTGADLVSIWNARVGLPAIREQAGAATLSAVINRRHGRDHYDAGEVGRVLGIPVAGIVREEPESAGRAARKQVPLPAAGGKVTLDLRALAKLFAGPGARAPQPRYPRVAALLPSLAGGR